MKTFQRLIIIGALFGVLLPSSIWAWGVVSVSGGAGAAAACGVDLCSGGTAIESGHTGNRSAAGAFANDGSTTRWQSFHQSIYCIGEWVGYDFGSEKTIIRLNMMGYTDFTGAFHLEGSNSSDFSTHTDYLVGSSHGNNDNWETFDFTNTTGYRYWRVVVDANGALGFGYCINELEMMDCIP